MKYNLLLLLISLLLAAFFIAGCASSQEDAMPISQKTNAELEYLLKSFENDSQIKSDYAFYEIIEELRKRGPAAAEVAPTLAQVIAFNGSASVTASYPLIAMGSSAQTAIPYLLQNLEHPREDVRLYSVFTLGTIGNPAKCATPKVAALLWDEDPYVRSTAAAALSDITSIMLVESDDILDSTQPGMVPNDLDGKISEKARTWWVQTGQSLDWDEESCLLE